MRDHREHNVRTGLAAPPIDDWERQGALRELTRSPETSSSRTPTPSSGRLGRLTSSQRAAVAAAMERILELGDQ